MTDGNVNTGPWRAHWCWTRKHLSRPWNSYAYFRKSFTLSAEPRHAVVRVSADARYTLFVNGHRVHHGPARSFPAHQSFDTIDIAPWLEAGPNAICAIGHQFGVPTFFSQYRDISGFVLDGSIELDGHSVDLHTPGGWLCREAKGWRKDVARLSVQMGFQEHFDADADPPDWLLPEFRATAEQGWAEPWVAGPVGCHPWLSVEPRGVPLLAQSVESFTTITSQFKGENARGYKITPDVYGFLRQEPRKRERSLLENAQAMLKDDAGCAVVSPPTDDDFIAAVLDLGTYRTGHIILDIAEAAGDEIIDIIFTAHVDKNGAPVLGDPGKECPCEEAPAFRYRCRPGAQRWESFQYLGLQYATLVFRNIQKPLKVRYVGVRQVHAAFDQTGSFECSDDRLNAIWRIAKNTQLNCSFDALVDCPSREQAQWWGDARVQGLVTAYAFGESTLLERGIRQMAQSQASDGSLHAHPPADIPGHRLPDFMLAWVGTIWEHHLQTGRVDLVRECLPTMHRVFEFFRQHETPNRLIGGFEGFWLFLDWAPLRKADFSATANLLYLQALRWAADLCELVGDERAAEYRKSAEVLQQSVDTHFWDAAGKVWRDGFDPEKNTPVEQVSQHANALAILLNLHPESHEKIARDVLLKPALARRTKVITASPFFYSVVLDAIVRAGLGQEAIGLIREKWGELVDRGASTFGEFWDDSGSPCHGWSASPLYHLSQQIVGVTPVSPGWTQVQIKCGTTELDFARGAVPTPFGLLRVEWEKSGDDQFAVRLDVPEGMTVQFIGPAKQTLSSFDAGAHEFHT